MHRLALLALLALPTAAHGQILTQSWASCGGTTFQFCFSLGIDVYDDYMDWRVVNYSGAVEGSEAGAGIVSIGFPDGPLRAYDPVQGRDVEQLYHTTTSGVLYDGGDGAWIPWLNMGSHTRNLTTAAPGYASGTTEGAIFSGCWDPSGPSAWISSAGSCAINGAGAVTLRMEKWFHDVVWDPVRNGALTVVAQLTSGERSVWTEDTAAPGCGCGM